MRRPILIPALLLFSLSAAARTEPTDSVRHLDEVVVQSDMQHTSPTSTTYVPTKRVKEAAANATDLLLRMAIPQIAVNPQSQAISTPAGQSVAVFINYLPATPEDMQGLRTADVRKVEYLDFPSDPRFRGEPHVVNITVQEYEYGGYTKINEMTFTGSGVNNRTPVFSKFSYKKMVYDAYVSTNYVNTRHIGSSTYSTYRLAEGDVERNAINRSNNFKTFNLPLTFRATYNSDNIQISNTIGYNRTNRFRNLHSGELQISNAPEGNYLFFSDAPSSTNAISWNGQYYFSLPRRWSLSLSPLFSYSRNNSDSRYHTDLPGDSPITNNARENAYDLSLSANIKKQLNDCHSISLNINSGSSINNVHYLGDSPFKTDFSNTFASAKIGYNISYEKINGWADFGVCGEFLRTNGIKYDDWYPYAHLSLNYSPNRKNQLGVWFQYATSSPMADMRSPNIIRSNEFLYQTGEPELDNARHVTAMLSYTLLPCNELSASFFGQYYAVYDRPIAVYTPYGDGNALIRSFRNDGDYTDWKAGATITLRLLRQSLIIQLSPTFDAYRSSGYFNAKRNPFSLTAYAAYYLGNFNFSAYYTSRSHSMSEFSPAYTTKRAFYTLSAGWSKGDWNLQASAYNFCGTSYRSSWTDTMTPLYQARTITYNSNNRLAFMLSATYTISYGKKISRGNEVGAQSTGTSAIMK